MMGASTLEGKLVVVRNIDRYQYLRSLLSDDGLCGTPELELQQALERAPIATCHPLELKIGTCFFEQSDKARNVPLARVMYRQHESVFVPVSRKEVCTC